MFVPENKIHRFSDIAYQHQGVINNYSKEIDKDSDNGFRAFIKKFMSPVLKSSRKLKKRSKLYRKLLETLLPIDWLRRLSWRQAVNRATWLLGQYSGTQEAGMDAGSCDTNVYGIFNWIRKDPPAMLRIVGQDSTELMNAYAGTIINTLNLKSWTVSSVLP